MKKIVSILAIIAVLFGMVSIMSSCGSDDEKTTSPDGENITQAVEEADDSDAKIGEAIDLINAIGTVTVDSKAAIEAAREAYKALSADEKTKVNNYSALETAEADYKALAQAEKDKIIEMYKSNFEADEDKVEGITWFYPNNMPDYIDTRSYVIPMIGLKEGKMWICVRYNYTEDDWIFWEKLTIVSDGDKYYKTVGYYNTVRDNGGGVVWEYYDDVFDYNQSMDTDDLKRLEKIGNSEETIIRFEGDNYYYDLEVSDKDKAMIRDVLEMYSAYIAY